ncbi:MAG: hypothetical protein NT161_03535 [Candidatus Nomurabacteria bacterium]|nr:hypothetical protein [Candidatus Nomurabacteria bacterium]
MLGKSSQINNDFWEESSEFELKMGHFLNGRMNKDEAEDFVNECLEDKKKLEDLIDSQRIHNILQKLINDSDFLDKIKKMDIEHQRQEKVKKILKDIYGVDFNNLN